MVDQGYVRLGGSRVPNYSHCQVTVGHATAPDTPADQSGTARDPRLEVVWRLGSTTLKEAVSRVPLSELLDRSTPADTEDEDDEDDTSAPFARYVADIWSDTDLHDDIFKALAPREVRGALLDHLNRFLGSGDGVRIAVACAPELEVVPWELMCHRGTYFALEPGVSVVRLGDLTVSDQPVSELRDAIRINYVDAGRALGAEYPRLRGSLERAEIPPGAIVQTRSGPRVIWNAVRESLEDGEARVFHFSGHGAGSTAEDDAALLFSPSKNGSRPRRVAADDLGKALVETGYVLAVLAACSAATDDRWTGLGAGLLAEGLSAVISMQERLNDQAGDEFAKELYGRLAAGDNLDDAVASGRRALKAAGHADWWLPVLHTRVTDPIRFAPLEKQIDPGGTGLTLRQVTRGSREVPWPSPHGAKLATPHPPIGRAADIVLSPDGGSCAVVADGRLAVGNVDRSGDIVWWPTLEVPGAVRVLAVQHRLWSAEVLLQTASVAQRVNVVARGGGSVRPLEAAASAGMWLGGSLVWIDPAGVVQLEGLTPSIQLPEKARLVDVAVGGDHLLAGWVHDQHLTLVKAATKDGSKFETHSTKLGFEPDGLRIGRTSFRSGVTPAAAYLTYRNELWSCDWPREADPATASA